MSRLTIIVAATKSHGIGSHSRLPWRLPGEIKYFARVTSNAPDGKQNCVVMGRNTWESIPNRFRPLPKRINVVISRNPDYDLRTDNAAVVLKDNLQSAFALTSSLSNSGNVHRSFIMGGAQIYSESLALPLSGTEPGVDRILMTRILSPEFDCDVFLDDFRKGEWRRVSHNTLQEWVGFEVPEGEQEENGIKYEFQMWIRDGPEFINPVAAKTLS